MGGAFCEEVKPILGLAPASQVAGTVNGASTSLAGYRSAVLSVLTGAASGTPTTISVAVTIQTSPDGTAWTSATGGPHIAITAASSLREKDVTATLLGSALFVRAQVVISFTGGTAPAIPVAAVWIMGDPVNSPV